MAAPCTTFRFVGSRTNSFAVAISKIETDASRLFVATSSFPSDVTPRLYTPFPAGMRRTSDQFFVSTSTISLDLLHATKTRLSSTDGCAHVGEHVTDATFIFIPSCASPPLLFVGAPLAPNSLPALTRNVRDTFMFSA